MKKKTIDLGEYIVTIEYNKATGDLSVNVLDELGDIIESIFVTEDKSDGDDEPDIDTINFNISLS